MYKNKLHWHLVLFLVLISTTAFFGYQAFYVEKNGNEQIETKKNTEVNQQNKNDVAKNVDDEITKETDDNQILTKIDTKKITPEKIVSTTSEEILTTINNNNQKAQLPYYADIIIGGKKYTINFEKEGIILKDLLDKLQTESDFSFSGKNYPGIGFFVNEMNGTKNDNKQGKYWVYYLNGQSAQVGISNQKINSGDNIEWKYEKSTF